MCACAELRLHNQRGMASEREVANALTLLAEANLSSVHSRADLHNLIEEYFCTPADDLIEADSDSRSDDDDDEAAAESDSEEQQGESVDEVSVVLKDVSTLFISEDAAKEADTVSKFRCSCQLNDGHSCYSQYQPEEVLQRRMQMQELTTGNYAVIVLVQCLSA